MSGRNRKWAIRVQPVRVMGLHVLLFGLSTLTVMWSSISLVRIQVLSWKKVQVCDNCYILKLRVATFLNMLQLFPTVPTKTEISQAATVQGRYNVNRGIKFLTFCQKIKNKNLNFSFPITLLLVSDFKKKKIEDMHRLPAGTQAVCHLWRGVWGTTAKASSCFTGSFEPWPKGRLQQSAGSWISGSIRLTAETVNRSALLWCRRLCSGLTITSHGLPDRRG